MANNPLIPQGVLNRVRASVSVINTPALNITASNMGKEMLSLAFDGDASGYIPTATGAVPTPEPYRMATVTVHLLRTQSLSALWKSQEELSTSIGDINVSTNASTLTDYALTNCTIIGIADLNLSGEDAGYVLRIKGTYLINSSMWSLV